MATAPLHSIVIPDLLLRNDSPVVARLERKGFECYQARVLEASRLRLKDLVLEAWRTVELESLKFKDFGIHLNV